MRSLKKMAFPWLLLFSVPAVAVVAATPDSGNRIESIQAQLFYDTDGSWSENIIDNKDFMLANTVIGEGSAKHPAHALLVKIKVVGPESRSAVRVEIRRRSGKKARPLVREVAQVVMLEGRTVYLPYLVKDIGCDPIEISAKMVARNAGQAVQKVIPLSCGE